MEEKFSFTYMECFISIEDKYELENITIFSVEADYDFEFQGSYDNIWISFEKDTNEMYRVIEIPDNVYATGECGNSTHTLDSFNTFDDALFFFENLKTISFKKLKKLAGYPDNENLCYFNHQKNKIIGTDDNKVEIEKTYHSNGELKEEFETLDGDRHGYYKLYHDNGQLKVIVNFENGIQTDGIVESLDENGSLIRSVFIKIGNLNGPFKEYYSSGKIKREGEYKDGEIIGMPIEYFEDGRVKQNIEDETVNQNSKNDLNERYYVYLEQFVFFTGEEDEEVDEEKYFVALSVSLKSMDFDEDDGEIDDSQQLVRSVLKDTKENELILTYINGEKLPLRVSELPEIIESELYEDHCSIEENLTLDEAITFIKSLKTVDFNDLKSTSQDQRLLIFSEIK